MPADLASSSTAAITAATVTPATTRCKGRRHPLPILSTDSAEQASSPPTHRTTPRWQPNVYLP